MKKIVGLVFSLVLLLAVSANAQTQRGQDNNVYGSDAPAKPVSPYGSNATVGGFKVTKFKESKTQRKLRRGEGRTRMSVPTPKGKPLKHKKKRTFFVFN